MHTAAGQQRSMAGQLQVNIERLQPPRDLLRGYDRTLAAEDQRSAVPKVFLDAMTIREEVFVQEQAVPLENEFDWDDARSIHWVMYITDLEHDREPAGTVRVVPYPHPPHPDSSQRPQRSSHPASAGEPYYKIGRLAVRKQFRKMKLGGFLVNTALQDLQSHPELSAAVLAEAVSSSSSPNTETLPPNPIHVLAHAQKPVQKVWERYGFHVDPSMGEWQEEGIWHVGMWRRLSLSDAST